MKKTSFVNPFILLLLPSIYACEELCYFEDKTSYLSQNGIFNNTQHRYLHFVGRFALMPGFGIEDRHPN
jgi:hypothetical protein